MDFPVPIMKEGAPRNIVFESPHQSKGVPPALHHHEKLMDVASRRCDTQIDLVADYVLGKVGGTLLYSPVSRMVVDLNRGADRVDSRVCPTWPGAKVYEDGGVIVPMAKQGGRLEKIYDRPLAEEEVESRLTQYWYPYHEALQKKVNGTAQRFGHAILLSLHSANPFERHAKNTKKPIIYLGTNHGATCDAAILSVFRSSLESCGVCVIAEDDYQGAFTTQAYGKDRNVHAIQIEMDRRFLDSDQITETLGPNAIQTLDGLVQGLLAVSIAGVRPPAPSRARRMGSTRTYIDPLTGEIQPF